MRAGAQAGGGVGVGGRRDAGTQPALSDRRIVWAMGASVVMHSALLLVSGFPWPHRAVLPEQRELALYLEPSARLARSPHATSTPLAGANSAASVRSPALAAVPPMATAAAATGPASTRESEVPSAGTFARKDPEVLVSEGQSEDSVRTPGEEGLRTHSEIVTPAQQIALIRSVATWAQGFATGDLEESQRSWQEDGQRYTAVLRRDPAPDSMALEYLTVEITRQADAGEGSTGEAAVGESARSDGNGRSATTRMRMKRLAFSHFTQLIDRWDMQVQVHDDVIAGRFHSNSSILLLQDHAAAPRFLGTVTTAARRVAMSGCCRRRTEIFQRGVETGTARITLPGRFVPFAPQLATHRVRTHTFERDSRIIFDPDGSYTAQLVGFRARGMPQARQMIPAEEPLLILGADTVTLRVRGTVRGKVLVYSPQRIVIEGDLVYARDPRTDPGSADYLGLVSDRNIEVAGPGLTGRGDLEIHAAVYAKRRFVVTHEDASSSGTLVIYGSLSAGTLSATEPRYATRIEFDPRLEQRRPPGFPMTARYEVEAWDGKWRVAEAQ